MGLIDRLEKAGHPVRRPTTNLEIPRRKKPSGSGSEPLMTENLKEAQKAQSGSEFKPVDARRVLEEEFERVEKKRKRRLEGFPEED